MFYLVFGAIWICFMGVFTYAFYGTDGPVSVNGQPISHEEFVEMVEPALFLAIFWLVGLIMLFIGIKKLLTDGKTRRLGYDTFGVITDIHRSGTRVNGRSLLNASVAIITQDNVVETYIENIGFNKKNYQYGDYVKIKHYQKDINILEHALEYEIPHYHLEILQKHSPIKNYEDCAYDDMSDGEVIVINGKRYRSID